MRQEVVGKKQCIPSIPVHLHMAFYAQMFLTSFQYVLAGRQKQLDCEQKQLLRMECGEAAWLIKNKKYPANVTA
jgi:hypothetical protein